MTIRGVVFDLDDTIIRSSNDYPKMKCLMIGILEANGVPGVLLTANDFILEIFEKAEKA